MKAAFTLTSADLSAVLGAWKMGFGARHGVSLAFVLHESCMGLVTGAL